MKSYLIKDTTKEERIALIREWIPADEIMDVPLFFRMAQKREKYVNERKKAAFFC